MAEGKNSFILYADYYDQIKELSDEEAGKIMKHLFSYVNDENPAPLQDRLLRLVFEPIKKQLKRDLKEWEGTKSKKSEAGRLGNLKKYQPDLYDAVKTGGLPIEEAESIARHRIMSQCDANAAVTVTVNDNVTVNDTVTDTVPVSDAVYKNFAEKEFLIPSMENIWLEKNPKYFSDKEKDYHALMEISAAIALKYNLDPLTLHANEVSKHAIKLRWGELVTFIAGHNHFKNYSLAQISKHLQSIFLSKDNGTIKNHRKSLSVTEGYDDI
jgi:hypothetical protein